MTKYKAKPTTVDGIRFASKKEARRYVELKLLKRAGQISWLRLQIKFPLYAATCSNDRYEHGQEEIAVYICDFYYQELRDKHWKTVVEDVKGVHTPIYQLKKRMMKANYGIEILET